MKRIEALLKKAIKEDVGTGDITTALCVPEKAEIKAVIIARGDMVVCGNNTAKKLFSILDQGIEYSAKIEDGGRAKRDDLIAEIHGKARPVLTGERTALNFMQRMSGIATLTAKFVEKTTPFNVAVLDTRKTTPLLREMEKHAVRCGGGLNHRMGLYDRILIKDNHIKFLRNVHEDGIVHIVGQARTRYPGILIEVEVETESEFINALKAKPDWILLDNMPPARLSKCAEICAGKCLLEASGGITLENIEEIARTGINAVSLGCLTHSAPSADLSLEVI